LFYDPYLKSINDWLIATRNREDEKKIGYISAKGNDFQNTNFIYIVQDKSKLPHPRGTYITDKNLFEVSIYFTVRHCIAQTWLNNQDQFLYPNDSWEKDIEFHYDCLVFTLLHGKNNITSKEGTNHWIPFTEQEVNARERFESDFMSRFIAGKIKKSNGNGDLFHKPKVENGTKCKFSPEAQDVFDAGKELWRYYHSQKDINVNASFYDIREYFQGRNEKGNRMNNSSTDQKYNELMGLLRERLHVLADKIAVKVYEHGFLL